MKLRGVVWCLLLGACRTSPPAQPTAPAGPSAGSLGALAADPPETVSSTPSLDPAPPVGVPLPRGVTVVDVTDGGGKASFHWRGWFAGNPYDAALLDRIAVRHDEGIRLSPTAAAFELYREDVAARGFALTLDAPGPGVAVGRIVRFVLETEDPPLAVTLQLRAANPDNPYEPKQEVIEVLVGPVGG